MPSARHAVGEEREHRALGESVAMKGGSGSFDEEWKGASDGSAEDRRTEAVMANGRAVDTRGN
jgi:hypothetical protein